MNNFKSYFNFEDHTFKDVSVNICNGLVGLEGSNWKCFTCGFKVLGKYTDAHYPRCHELKQFWNKKRKR